MPFQASESGPSGNPDSITDARKFGGVAVSDALRSDKKLYERNISDSGSALLRLAI